MIWGVEGKIVVNCGEGELRGATVFFLLPPDAFGRESVVFGKERFSAIFFGGAWMSECVWLVS